MQRFTKWKYTKVADQTNRRAFKITKNIVAEQGKKQIRVRFDFNFFDLFQIHF